MAIRAVVIDDERNNIDNLSILLKKLFPDLEIVGVATNGMDGEKLILQGKPDIVFLDIQMPQKNGFELLTSLPDHHFELIFVTGFDQFGIQAVKFSAIDYLLKPIKEDELKKAVEKAIGRILEKKQNRQLENLLALLQHQHQKEEHRIALPSARETRFVRTQEIVRCESSNNYTTFYLQHGEVIVTSKPIFEYEEVLQGYGFIRCHQTHLVNKRFIKSLIKQDGGYLLLENGSKIPISKLKKEQVKRMLE
ncbi:LytR/AlgR family response regulator transcription factor [Paraflavitalea pollutisoli]|uniref:LytR/AlgR family response regulator transcription factor n=1 Tax=Paraflavitalea pollutisoli TaxID=3034143 RepID=UPI0023EB2D04|nr:LytTR family DNA-binding domain-containing protein [Paraflavitalea sp. H1-2-19X]